VLLVGVVGIEESEVVAIDVRELKEKEKEGGREEKVRSCSSLFRNSSIYIFPPFHPPLPYLRLGLICPLRCLLGTHEHLGHTQH